MPTATVSARSCRSVAKNDGRGGVGVVHGKGAVAAARVGERARDRTKKRRVGKQKFQEGEAEAMYIYV